MQEFGLDLTGTYIQSSGAGGWEEELIIDDSGKFEALFHDVDADKMTYLAYSGSFTDLAQEEGLKYTVQVKNIKKEIIDEERFSDYSEVVKADFDPSLQDGNRISIF